MRSAKKRKRRSRRWLLAAAAAGIAGICVFGAVTLRLYRQRKATEAMIAARTYTESDASVRFHGDIIEHEGKTYRRNSYVKAILCMGVDRKGEMLETTTYTFGGQADGIFVVAQDTVRNTLKILMVPRDSMTEITLTDLSGNELGRDIQHLTLAYAYGDGREKSCELTSEAVSGLLGGLTIDHYMAANIDVINIMNDSVGGVTVTVPSAGMEKKDAAFIEGERVTLHGEQAEAFVRYRDIEETHSAIYRMERQQEYISEFFDVVKKKASVNSGIVVELLDRAEDHMVTDMGKEEYLKVALDALEMNGLEEEDFYVVPGQAVMSGVYDEFYVDQEALTPVILEMFYREVS